MREARRLALARRQNLLAQVARREALAGLAEAVAEESKSAQIAKRSAQLVQDYAARELPLTEAATLRNHAGFVRSLHQVHEQAASAHDDAQDQARWQSSTLAAAQTRADRMEQRLSAAKRALRTALEKREGAEAAQMARRLQDGEDNNPSAPKRPFKRTKP